MQIGRLELRLETQRVVAGDARDIVFLPERQHPFVRALVLLLRQFQVEGFVFLRQPELHARDAGAVKDGRPKFWPARVQVDRDPPQTLRTVEQIRTLVERKPEIVVVPAHDGGAQRALGFFPVLGTLTACFLRYCMSV